MVHGARAGGRHLGLPERRGPRLATDRGGIRRSTIFHRYRPSVPLCPDRHLSAQFGREYSSRAAGRARRKRHMAWSSRVGLRPTDPRTRTAYQGAGGAGPPPGPTERDQALREALEAARAIGDEGSRSAALAALAPHLTATGSARRWRRRGPSGTRGPVPGAGRAGPHLTAPAPRGAGGGAGIEARGRSRRWPRWPPPGGAGPPAEALEAARAIEYEGPGPSAGRAGPPPDRAGCSGEALEAARAIGDEGSRSAALAALAPHLGPTERDQPCARRWRRRGRSRTGGPGPEAWRRWPPTWGRPSGTKPSARRWRRRGRSRRGVPVRGAGRAGPPPDRPRLLGEALEAARAIGDEGSRSQALAALAPHLAADRAGPGPPREALEAARAIGDEGSRSRALAALAPRLAELGQPGRGAGGGAGDRGRGGPVRGAGRAGPPPGADRAGPRPPRGAGGGAGHRGRVAPVPGAGGAGPHLAPELAIRPRRWRRRGRSRSRGTGPRRWPRWPPTWRSWATPGARRWRRRGPSRASSPGPGAGRAGPPPDRRPGLREALEAARAIGDEEARSEALAALAPHLTERALLREALEAARAIGDRGVPVPGAGRAGPPPDRALARRGAGGGAGHRRRGVPVRALAAPAPRLAELGHPAEALEAARAIGDEGSRSEALAALAPHLTEPLLGEALEAARAIGDEGDRSAALAALAPRLAELGHPAEALEAARAIGDEGYRSVALAALAPDLAGAGPPGRGAGGGAGDRVRGVPVPGAGRAGPPPGADRAGPRPSARRWRRRGRSGTRIGPGPEALARAGPPPGGARPPGRGAGGGAGRSRARGPGPGRWPRWPPTWGRPSGTKPCARRWRRRGRSSTEGDRSEALAALAPRLAPTERDQALREALEAARAIETRGTGPRRWPRWPPAWRSWATRPRRWRRRGRSGTSGTGPRRWPRWPPT